jgi:transposase-like protein
VPHARRRQFSNADKRRILDAADRCTRPGEVGALMRQEGVYSSSLSTWRRQREAGDLASLAPQKRGPKIPANRAETLQIVQLTRERDGLQRELDKAMLVIGVQNNLSRCPAWPNNKSLMLAQCASVSTYLLILSANLASAAAPFKCSGVVIDDTP